MERFWTLQYLKQHHITELSATVFKAFPGQPPMARADDLPLVLPVFGGGDLPRGAHVQLRLGEIDDITLDISGHLLHLLEGDAPSNTNEAELVDDEDDTAAGPIALAMDVNEAPSSEGSVG
jgi:exoribonuclease-2